MLAFLCWEKKSVWSTTAAEQSSPLREIPQDFSCKITQQWVLGARQTLQLSQIFLQVSLHSYCSCMDLPMPHPAVTCSNQAVSEIYSFSPIRGYKQCKNTDEELCKAANAVLSPGCCNSGEPVCTHLCELLWLPCCQGHSQLPTWTGAWVFYQKALGWGCSIVELLQRNWSNTYMQ